MNEYKFSDIAIGLGESFEVKIDASKMDKFLDISNEKPSWAKALFKKFNVFFLCEIISFL